MQKTYVLQIINKKQMNGGQLLNCCVASILFETFQHTIASAFLLRGCLHISLAAYHILAFNDYSWLIWETVVQV